jgi:hypothetical protein
MATASKSPNENVGVWISGSFGCGKSSFAKNLGYVLENREVKGESATSLFLKQVESKRIAESAEFLNRAVRYQAFMFGVEMLGTQGEPPVENDEERILEERYKVLLRDLDYGEDFDIAELEMELEKAGKLEAFQELCRAEYREDWRAIREGSQKFTRTSDLLHKLDPAVYTSSGMWVKTVKAGPSKTPAKIPGVKDLVEKSFNLCEIRCPGRSPVFIMDEIGQYAARSGERLDCLRGIVEQFGRESLKRMKAGKIPGPAWIVVTAEENLQQVFTHLIASRIDWPKIQASFTSQIELSPDDIREAVVRRVLRKKPDQELVLRKLFRESGAPLIQNLKLERSTRGVKFNEDQFVRYYPFLPFSIDLFFDIVTGILVHPRAPKHLGEGNRSIVRQAFAMFVSDRTRFLDRPVGEIVSLDRIYDLLERDIPPEKQKDVVDIRERLDHDEDYPGMPGRVAKAICLLEFARKDLPCTTKNLAALLIQRANDAPPVLGVAAALFHMKEAQFVRETEYGWLLYGLDKPRRAIADLEWQRRRVGTVNPRPPGWRNDLIQYLKKWFARSLTWYTRPLRQYTTTATRAFEGVIWSLEHLSENTVTPEQLSRHMVAFEQLSMDVVALEARLTLSENRNAALTEALATVQNTGQHGIQLRMNPCPAKYKTTYIIGLFGTGRRYINELVLRNIGERIRYFRDTVRLHPGPTPMIYSGHATVKYLCRDQEAPTVMGRILEAVDSGFANLIFVYRHPLDSLLTNWVWWRTYIRDNRWIAGISQIYKTTDDFCADLEANFLEFKTFAEGDPVFFAAAPGPPFLSFRQFVEETELHLQAATLTLRLEDFAIDPRKQFYKLAKVLAIDLNASHLSITPPKSKPYGYLAVKEKVAPFRQYIEDLDAETKSRIEKIGYNVKV